MDSSKVGFLQIAAGAIALLHSGAWASQGAWPAYLAVGLAIAYGVLLVSGRLKASLGNGLVGLLLDASLVTVLVGSTGGGSSLFFPFYLLAALGVYLVPGIVRGVVGVAAVTGGYPIAVLLADGPGAILSTEVALRVGLIALFCVVAAFMGSALRSARENSRALASALDVERRHGEEVAALVSRFGPVLEVLSAEEMLRWAAETARWSLGAPYAHAAMLEGNNHWTAVEGDLDVYPSWWHPKIQRLVLWSCRTRKVLRDEGVIHDIEGFMALPLICAEGEQLGAVVVGGRNFGAADERILKVLTAGIAPVLRSVSEAPGGREPVTGLPNRASLHRVLRRELSSRTPLTILVVRLDGFERHERAHGTAAADAVRGKLGEKLRSDRQRVFCSGRDELVVLLRGNDAGRADGYARGLRRLIAESTSGSAVSLAASVGFVAIGPEGGDPDLALGAARGALREAGDRPERILGLPAGIGTVEGSEVGTRLGETVQALLEAIGACDPYLAEHSKAVSGMARRIGSRMGLVQGQLEALTIGALLHDLGKIAVPDSILQKTGPLTEEEYETIKQHPVLGARILSPIRELSAMLPAVRHHHERFDGEGYPDGLRGAEISLLARITFAADAFDSLTRDRGYRRGAPMEAALEELVRNAGTQLDPDVVKTLVQVVRETGDRRFGIAE